MTCILVIDTNPRIRTGLRHILEYAGYDVVEAHDSGEGIRSTRLRSIALVILDLQRPAPERVEAMRALQTVMPAVKMIAIAGEGSTDHLPGGASAALVSAHRTLQKPVSAQDLLAAVQEVLAGS